MTLHALSYKLSTSNIPIVVFTELDESDAEYFPDADALWKRVLDDKQFANRDICWFSIRDNAVTIRIEI